MLRNLDIFKLETLSHTTRRVALANGGEAFPYSDLSVGRIEGLQRTIPALVSDGVTEGDNWYVVNLVDVSNGMSRYVQSVAVLGATSKDQAAMWALKNIGVFIGANDAWNTAITSTKTLKTFLDRPSTSVAIISIRQSDLDTIAAQITDKPVVWDGSRLTSHDPSTLLHELVKHDDEVTMMDAMTPSDLPILMIEMGGEIAEYDALIVDYNRLDLLMQRLNAAMQKSSVGNVKPVNVTQSKPFKRNSVTNVAALFEMNDGQSVTIVFHSPDNTPAKLAPSDTLTSWKWMLNKRDISAAVSPKNGENVQMPDLAKRILTIVEKNSARFTRTNGNKAAQVQELADTNTRIGQKQEALAGILAINKDLQKQIDDAGKQPEVDGRITPDTAGNMKNGDIVRTKDGTEFMSLGARHDWLEVAPMINGKPQVNNVDTFKFLLSPEKASAYPERRNEPIYPTGKNYYNDNKGQEPVVPVPTPAAKSTDLTDEEYAALKKAYNDFKAKTDKIGAAKTREDALKIAADLVTEMPEKEDQIRRAFSDAIRDNKWYGNEINFPKQPVKVATDIELNRTLKRLQKALEGTEYSIYGTFKYKGAKLEFAYGKGLTGKMHTAFIEKRDDGFYNYDRTISNYRDEEYLKPLMDATVDWLNGKTIPKMFIGEDFDWSSGKFGGGFSNKLEVVFNEAKAKAAPVTPVTQPEQAPVVSEPTPAATQAEQPASEPPMTDFALVTFNAWKKGGKHRIYLKVSENDNAFNEMDYGANDLGYLEVVGKNGSEKINNLSTVSNYSKLKDKVIGSAFISALQEYLSQKDIDISDFNGATLKVEIKSDADVLTEKQAAIDAQANADAQEKKAQQDKADLQQAIIKENIAKFGRGVVVNDLSDAVLGNNAKVDAILAGTLLMSDKDFNSFLSFQKSAEPTMTNPDRDYLQSIIDGKDTGLAPKEITAKMRTIITAAREAKDTETMALGDLAAKAYAAQTKAKAVAKLAEVQ